jgi:hypothetical protein
VKARVDNTTFKKKSLKKENGEKREGNQFKDPYSIHRIVNVLPQLQEPP